MYNIILYFLLLSTAYLEADPIPLPPQGQAENINCSRSPLFPFFTSPPHPDDQAHIQRLISDRCTQSDRNFGCFYLQALSALCEYRYDTATQLLEHSLLLCPFFYEARLQLAYIYLWQTKWQTAADTFEEVLISCPCHESALNGLEKVAHVWEQEKANQAKALNIYRILVQCQPDNSDYLFYLGRSLSWMHQWEEAEQVLKRSLELFPQNSDAGVQLGTLYLWQEKWEQAKTLFERFISRPEAKIGLAKIAERQSDFEEAEKWYKEAIQQGLNNSEIKQGLARVLAQRLQYKKAKKEYEACIKERPSDDGLRRELFEVKLHTDPTCTSDTRYTQSKENDPNLKAPVVRDYYFDTNLCVLIPVLDKWRLDVCGFWGFQKEKDIYPPTGINYDIQKSGANLNSHYFFLRNWRWDFWSRIKRAWGIGKMFYPFISTTRFEPGTSLLYHSDSQLFNIAGYVDSFIIKNFSIGRSELLRLDTLEGTYGYTFPVKLHPEIEAIVKLARYHDTIKNVRNDQSLQLSLDFPFLEKYLSVFYRFDHKSFKHITTNYYSFKQQWIQTIGCNLHSDISAKTYADVLYEHQWLRTKDLLQPIGSFIFTTPLQILTANKIQGLVGLRVFDFLRAEIKSHFYRSTLPYKEWNIQGSLIWIF